MIWRMIADLIKRLFSSPAPQPPPPTHEVLGISRDNTRRMPLAQGSPVAFSLVVGDIATYAPEEKRSLVVVTALSGVLVEVRTYKVKVTAGAESIAEPRYTRTWTLGEEVPILLSVSGDKLTVLVGDCACAVPVGYSALTVHLGWPPPRSPKPPVAGMIRIPIKKGG